MQEQEQEYVPISAEEYYKIDFKALAAKLGPSSGRKYTYLFFSDWFADDAAYELTSMYIWLLVQ